MKTIMAALVTTLAAVPAFAAGHANTAAALASRIVPTLASDIVFETIDAPADTFAVSARDGKVLIEGNNAGSMAVGLNNYLRRQLGASVSWFATEPVQVPDAVVLPDTAYGARAAVGTRFFLNYCTFGYTMPYWQWPEWERFIDWMALNGVNMPLAMTGAEKSWYDTWRSMGLSDDEIRSSFTGPGHLPWHWMNNIDCFQGPLSPEWLTAQEKLQKRILARERELGMTPVLPAFAGHVPAALARHYPQADITEHSVWGEFPQSERCYFLSPSDPLYAEIQKRFIDTQTALYGTDHIYGIDPFNEVDSPDWSENFLRNASRGIFTTLRAADPQARWLQMTWNFYYDRKHWTKPRMEAFLDGVEGDNMLLLDYFCDNVEIWRRNDRYFGKPYIWCYLGNFGGNTMINGNMHDVDKKISAVMTEGGDNLTGLGGTLEGFDCNPVMHEFMLAKAWAPDMSANDWATVWARSRGGDKAPSVVEAWQLMADSIYVGRTYVGNSCLTNARPALDKPNGSYTSPRYHYSDSNLLRVLDLLLQADGIDDNAAYQFDVMNVTRQALGNEFNHSRDRFNRAYLDGDPATVKAEAARMADIIADLDALMATNPQFSMTQWIADARRHGTTAAEADTYEKNARTLLTIWSYPDKKLNDYANRQWSGLLSDFYGQRWQMFTDAVIDAMDKGVPFDEEATTSAIKQWEGSWAASRQPVTPLSDARPTDLARKYREKYLR